MIFGEIENSHDLLTGDGVKGKKSVDGFAALEQIDKALDGDAGIAEAGCAAHALGIDPDCFVELRSLQIGHIPTLAE